MVTPLFRINAFCGAHFWHSVRKKQLSSSFNTILLFPSVLLVACLLWATETAWYCRLQRIKGGQLGGNCTYNHSNLHPTSPHQTLLLVFSRLSRLQSFLPPDEQPKAPELAQVIEQKAFGKAKTEVRHALLYSNWTKGCIMVADGVTGGVWTAHIHKHDEDTKDGGWYVRVCAHDNTPTSDHDHHHAATMYTQVQPHHHNPNNRMLPWQHSNRNQRTPYLLLHPSHMQHLRSTK